ncbi:hypothetical protein GWO43_06550 [candidate division KSB1 bacterium]|nr:hypothetical protein [candidate division KSB1 bacterium]NIR72512.1 hypothetical protein [candidate division KSB1 bacterium]NIS23620.1 hypothetical protein [candidate division KSB1 bacterium]NIT70546.1 hypothetical protein [candidate division KSB1 bacterium]NIU24253.1 hypothetical protein [candidate division KSB1 bacterium]
MNSKSHNDRPSLLIRFYYLLKPIIPRRLQICLRRIHAKRKRYLYSDIWPILTRAGRTPANWPGWPDQKKFALVLTHDVETALGHSKCEALANLEETLGFRSSFNFVPERYQVSPLLRQRLSERGFEVGVHGLLHDGKLFRSREIFRERARRINQYLNEWDAVGFRAPAMHHNLEWLHGLNIEYDLSTFDTDPFEPQSDGVEMIFPFWVNGAREHQGYVELPYTLPQDHALFVILKERTIDIWKEKLHWIVAHGGMALLNVHPDYIIFNGSKLGLEEFPAAYYTDFLMHIKRNYEGEYWHALPRQVARFCRVLKNHESLDLCGERIIS